MSARLVLARHGNTFRPEDEPLWVGARSDLPLVEKGVEQAKILAEALRKSDLMPELVITGPLQRTTQTASIVAKSLNIPEGKIRIDARLKEIDYGAWEGKSSAAIIAAGEDKELQAWNKYSIFPANPGWRPSEAQLFADSGSMLEETIPGTSLIVTSNGILRFFARVALNANEYPDLKVATGHLCIMQRATDGSWHILEWNLSPDRLLV